MIKAKKTGDPASLDLLLCEDAAGFWVAGLLVGCLGVKDVDAADRRCLGETLFWNSGKAEAYCCRAITAVVQQYC